MVRFFDNSFNAIKKCLERGDKLYLSSSAVTDIFYIMRKAKGKEWQEVSGKYIQTLNYDAHVLPGHGDPTTLQNEILYNPFFQR